MSNPSPATPEELHFLLGRDGSLIVYQEKDTSWVGVPVFSTEEKAREFVRASHIDAAEIVSLGIADRDSLGALIRSVKKRAARNLLLDLDYQSGRCTIVEFLGDGLGPAREWQFAPKTRR